MGQTPDSLNRDKAFRDNVHDYIRIPDVIVHEIIDTPLFQRLRSVEQTSMRSLFPAARHDRFVHSLGTYYLGCIAFDRLVRNSRQPGALDHLADEEGPDFRIDEHLRRRRLLFTLACLLHDCAHAPFSHTFERYYDTCLTEDGKPRLNEELKVEYAGDPDFLGDFATALRLDAPKPHERMSALMVRRYFRRGIELVFEHERLGEVTETDFALIARMIMGCTFEARPTPLRSFDDCLIRLLHSPTIDVDGLDYSTRDTVNSGVNNASIDYDRLLGSLCAVEASHFPDVALSGASFGGVFAAETELLPEPGKRYLKFESFVSFTGSATFTFESADDALEFHKWVGEGKLTANPAGQPSDVTLRDVCLQPPLPGHKITHLVLNDPSNIVLCEWSGTIRGTVLRSPEFVSSHISTMSSPPERRYAPAFDKVAVSVLEGALSARNHLYRTIYAHPQVVYRSNFLMHHLLRLSAKYLSLNEWAEDAREGRLPSDGQGLDGHAEEDRDVERAIGRILGLDGYFDCQNGGGRAPGDRWHFDKSDDNDILALFKWVYLDNHARGEGARNEDIERHFTEFFSRRGRSPLWKSHEEYRHFLSVHREKIHGEPGFDQLRKALASPGRMDYLFINASEGLPKDKGEETGGEVSAERALLACCEEEGYRDLLAIKAFRSFKSIADGPVFIRFSDDVERFRDVAGPLPASAKGSFIYLYYGGTVDPTEA